MKWLAALSAQDFSYRVARDQGRWVVLVPTEQAAAADRELAEYERVNRDWPPPSARGGTHAQGKPTNTVFSSLLVAVALLLWFLYTGRVGHGHNELLADRAAAVSTAIQDGEWWRTITALTLHADFGHVFSNAACLFAFGVALCRFLGPGTAWLAILLSGTLGNAAAAWLVATPRSALGASTAVFGAVGMLSVLQFYRHYRSNTHIRTIWHQAWTAGIAGLALLALLGTAPGTDIAGHFCGFVSGCVIALPGLLLPQYRHRVVVQAAIFAVVVLAVLGSWYIALH